METFLFTFKCLYTTDTDLPMYNISIGNNVSFVVNNNNSTDKEVSYLINVPSNEVHSSLLHVIIYTNVNNKVNQITSWQHHVTYLINNDSYLYFYYNNQLYQVLITLNDFANNRSLSNVISNKRIYVLNNELFTYQTYELNLYNIEEEHLLINESLTNEIQINSYQIKLYSPLYDTIETKVEFHIQNNKQSFSSIIIPLKQIYIISLPVDITGINNVLCLYKNNVEVASMYLSFPNDELISSDKIMKHHLTNNNTNCSNINYSIYYQLNVTPSSSYSSIKSIQCLKMSNDIYEVSSTIAKTNTWKIHLNIKDIIIINLSNTNFTSNAVLNIKTHFGNNIFNNTTNKDYTKVPYNTTKQQLQSFIQSDLTYNTISTNNDIHSYNEIPPIIVEVLLYGVSYYGKIYINNDTNTNNNTFILVPQERNNEELFCKCGIPMLIGKYKVNVNVSKIEMSVMNFDKDNKNNEDSFYNEYSLYNESTFNNNNHKHFNNSKMLSIGMFVFGIQFNMSECNRKGNVFIFVNDYNVTDIPFNENKNVNVNQYYTYDNIRLDMNVQETFPIITFIILYNNNHNNKMYYYSTYNLNDIIHNKNEWLNIGDIASINIAFDIDNTNTTDKGTNYYIHNELITGDTNVYKLDMVGIGLRNYNQNTNLISLLNQHVSYINIDISEFNTFNSINNSNNFYLNTPFTFTQKFTLFHNTSTSPSTPLFPNINLTLFTHSNIPLVSTSLNTNPLIKSTHSTFNKQIQNIQLKCTNPSSIQSLPSFQFTSYPVMISYKFPGISETSPHFHMFHLENPLTIPNKDEYKLINCNIYNKRYYRKYYRSTLEQSCPELMTSPFTLIKMNTLSNVYFKCLIMCSLFEYYLQLEQIVLSIKNTNNDNNSNTRGLGLFDKEFSFLDEQIRIKKEIEMKVKRKLHINIVEFNINLHSDVLLEHYFVIKVNGNERYSSKYNKYKSEIVIQCTFPEDATLTFELWESCNSKDKCIALSRDDNVIDIENRYYNFRWRYLKDKPIEQITLCSTDITNSEICSIYIWLDIDVNNTPINESNQYDVDSDTDENNNLLLSNSSFQGSNKRSSSPIPLDDIVYNYLNKQIYNTITLKPIVQVRLTIYETMYNDIHKHASNFYMKTQYKHNTQMSDIHYDCKDGCSYYNWRFMFNVYNFNLNHVTSTGEHFVYIYLYDYNYNNEALCKGCINISYLVYLCFHLNYAFMFTKEIQNGLNEEKELREITFENEYLFWVNLISNNITQGRTKVSLEILPYEQATIRNETEGRSSQFDYPFNRFETILSNDQRGYMSQKLTLSQALKRKIKCKAIKTCVILYVIFLIPFVIYHLIGEAANPFNYKLLSTHNED